MADRESPLFDSARGELGRLGGELKEMAVLRWELASLEVRVAAGQVKRLAAIVAGAAVGCLTALPVLVVYAADRLHGQWGLLRSDWLLIFGLGLLLVAALSAWLAVRRFRREFAGMEETLEELREDLVWLEEWTGTKEEA